MGGVPFQPCRRPSATRRHLLTCRDARRIASSRRPHRPSSHCAGPSSDRLCLPSPCRRTSFHTQGTASATRSATISRTPGIVPARLVKCRAAAPSTRQGDGSAVGRDRSDDSGAAGPASQVPWAPREPISSPRPGLLLDRWVRQRGRAESRLQQVRRPQHRPRGRSATRRAAPLSSPGRRPDLRGCRRRRARRDRCESPQGTLRWHAMALIPPVPTRGG